MEQPSVSYKSFETREMSLRTLAVRLPKMEAVTAGAGLNGIAPYIGRLRPEIAQFLVNRYTSPGDVIADPFSGSGCIPLMAAVMGRHVIASDMSPYAVLLTRAKLFAPPTIDQAMRRLAKLSVGLAEHARRQDLRRIPQWVRSFFHAETLRHALTFRDACVNADEPFFLACLLGILHHQRPGFLSFPSGHLVPHLRDRAFPPALFPEMYAQREVVPRLQAKLQRIYRDAPRLDTDRRIMCVDARLFSAAEPVDAVITSPPYMNELDYIRDNRLRLWFIDRRIPSELEIPKRKPESYFRGLIDSVLDRLLRAVIPRGHIILVLGEVTRNRRRLDPARVTCDVVSQKYSAQLRLKEVWADRIPDVRPGRVLTQAKREHILVFEVRGLNGR